LGIDLKILFLIMLAITGFLYYSRFGSKPILINDFWNMVLDLLILPSAITTGLIFFVVLFNIDYQTRLLEIIDLISPKTVSFISAVPPELSNSIQTRRVERLDTDADNFAEWVVFYEYDLQSGQNPVQITVYDNDRGNPPVIFPYQLRVPNRDYLSDSSRGVSVSLQDVVTEANGPKGQNIPEILVQDGRQLSIFKYNGKYDTNVWDPPSDSPARYSAIGAFKGASGVSLNQKTKDVTVVDQDKYNRSQLAQRMVYGLNAATNTYWDEFDSTRLVAPKISTVDFYPAPPSNIDATAYPEKTVLAFYASTCGDSDDTLCHLAGRWQPADFLLENDVAWNEFKNPAGGPAYFGLNSFTASQNLQVKDIRYYPALESTDTRDVVTGSQPRSNVVDITFTVDGSKLEESRSCAVAFINGQWKISECTPASAPVSSSAAGTQNSGVTVAQ